MTLKSKIPENKKNKIPPKYVINCLFALILLLFLLMYDADFKKGEKPLISQDEFAASSISRICELATLKCYYHDVAEYKKESGGLFNFFHHGYKKFWIEYDGVVEAGVDASQVELSAPDENGIVKIYVPEAKILNIEADPDSMNDAIADTGVFTSITATDRAEAFSTAQADMKKGAESDSNLLRQAQMNAKELLKQYVTSVGEQIGQHYAVRWVDKAEDI